MPDGRVLLPGGERAADPELEYLTSVEIYNPATGNWTVAPDLHAERARYTLSLLQDGTVLVDGFYDTVEPLGEVEMEALRNLPSYDEELKAELGLAWTEGEGQSLAERLLLPSLTVRGLTSGATGRLARNVIPSTATAAIGIRLVKGNDPQHMAGLVEEARAAVTGAGHP